MMTTITAEIAANVNEMVEHLISTADQTGYDIPAVLRARAGYLRTKGAQHNHIRAELMEEAASRLEAEAARSDDASLNEAYEVYTPGSQGLCAHVETHCGYEISRTEIERIAERAATPAQFAAIWADEDWWTDENN